MPVGKISRIWKIKVESFFYEEEELHTVPLPHKINKDLVLICGDLEELVKKLWFDGTKGWKKASDVMSEKYRDVARRTKCRGGGLTLVGIVEVVIDEGIFFSLNLNRQLGARDSLLQLTST